jgi:hypothetical protein
VELADFIVEPDGAGVRVIPNLVWSKLVGVQRAAIFPHCDGNSGFVKARWLQYKIKPVRQGRQMEDGKYNGSLRRR